jgi:hypothetical protein
MTIRFQAKHLECASLLAGRTPRILKPKKYDSRNFATETSQSLALSIEIGCCEFLKSILILLNCILYSIYFDLTE